MSEIIKVSEFLAVSQRKGSQAILARVQISMDLIIILLKKKCKVSKKYISPDGKRGLQNEEVLTSSLASRSEHINKGFGLMYDQKILDHP